MVATEWPLALCILLGAMLYSSVGHGGASAYIALMALFGVPPVAMRPTALVLNILVSSFNSVRYVRAGFCRWRTLWPFLVSAVPMAYLGGTISLPGSIYRPMVGVVLWLSALRLLWPGELKAIRTFHDPPVVLALLVGALIGLLSGLTGTGGGIFLSPILLIMAWSTPRHASGAASVFILVNSIAGLAGNYASIREIPESMPLFILAALAGSLIGTTLGIRFPGILITRTLGVVLIIAGTKMIGIY